MYGFAILLLFPLLGWWLIRTSRSLDRLAKVVNDNGVDLGFLSFRGRTSAVLLFSDVRFVTWLVRRKYLNVDLSPAVTRALDEARHDYLLIVAVMALIVLVLYAI